MERDLAGVQSFGGNLKAKGGKGTQWHRLGASVRLAEGAPAASLLRSLLASSGRMLQQGTAVASWRGNTGRHTSKAPGEAGIPVLEN